MIEQIADFLSSMDQKYLGILLSVALGVFIGIERERSDKMAGVRTFSLISLSGGSIAVIGERYLVLSGMVLVISIAVLMGLKDISTDDDIGLSLTTSAALFVTYIAGFLAGIGELLISSTVAIITATLLISKDSLHEFAGDVTKPEFYSALELLALSIIIYPFLPSENIGPWNSIDLQLVWLLVVAVSGLGFLNYILVKRYQEKGFIATGFFGGLVNSTAVIGTIADRVSDQEASAKLAISAILLANSAMAVRNAIIATAFVPSSFVIIAIPLVSISVTGVVISVLIGDWDSKIDGDDLTSPFSLKNALMFGFIFLVILVVSSTSTQILGDAGFYITIFLAGLVSSGTATTTAVTLISTSQVSVFVGSTGILVGTAASIVAKILLVASVDRKLAKMTLIWSSVLVLIGVITSGVAYFLTV